MTGLTTFIANLGVLLDDDHSLRDQFLALILPLLLLSLQFLLLFLSLLAFVAEPPQFELGLLEVVAVGPEIWIA